MTERKKDEYIIEVKHTFPPEVTSFCKSRAYEHQSEVLPDLKGKTFLDDHMYLPTNLIDIVNGWCTMLGLPRLHYAVLFQKHDLRDTKNNSIHIDYNADYNDVAKAALNVPILNFENTIMTWWSGDYEKKILYANQTCCKDTSPSGDIKIPYLDLKWNSDPVLEYSYKITNTPHLCKIDVPHGVTAYDRFRVVLSLRFEGNPSYEEIREMFYSRENTYDI